MAKQESSFDLKHIEETAAVETSSVLDQLNLPPALTDFLKKYQRIIWIVLAVVATVVTVVSLYGSYRNYTLNKAAQAYDQAMLLDGDARKAALQEVADTYGSTPTAIWSSIQLAHLEQNAGNLQIALDKLVQVNKGVSRESLLKPLLLLNIGGLYEQAGQADQAVTMYEELKTFKGFESKAVNSLGQVYESQGDKKKAAAMFQEYLNLTTVEGKGPQQDDPARIIVRAALNRLQQ
jgi:predicted negative regulator of RcsB-dependent stress response